MAATASCTVMSPDPRTPEQRKADEESWRLAYLQEQGEKRAAVRLKSESMLALEGATVSKVEIVQSGPVTEGYEDNDCHAVLTLTDGRRVKISAFSLDYEGEDAGPQLEVLS